MNITFLRKGVFNIPKSLVVCVLFIGDEKSTIEKKMAMLPLQEVLRMS